MKKNLGILLFVLSVLAAGFAFFEYSGRIGMLITFMCGAIAGMALGIIKLCIKNEKLSSYKRELEKESVESDSNASKVKVLEQKIEVLEKALENALKNK